MAFRHPWLQIIFLSQYCERKCLVCMSPNFFSGVEKLVLHSLTSIVDDHIPQLTKDKKTLTSLLLDYDAAKSRLVTILLRFVCDNFFQCKWIKTVNDKGYFILKMWIIVFLGLNLSANKKEGKTVE